MRHNYETAVKAALQTLVIDAAGDGERDVNALANALRGYARQLEEMRQGMKVSPVMRCHDCGRYWTTELTVRKEREHGCPENCPACFDAGLPARREEAARRYPGQPALIPQESCHKVYRYLTDEEAAAHFGD